MNIIEEIKNLKHNHDLLRKSQIEKIRKFKNVYVWGLTEIAKKSIELLLKNNIVVRNIYDSDKIRHGSKIFDIEVVEPDLRESQDKAYVVACGGYISILNRLANEVENPKEHMFLAFTGIEEDDYNLFFLNQEKDNIKKAYDLFYDNKSRLIFKNIIKYRYSRDEEFLDGIVDDFSEQYFFEEVVKNLTDGIVVDGGACLGGEIFKLIELAPNLKLKIYAFEPNMQVCPLLQERVKDLDNCVVMPIGLYEQKTELSFECFLAGSSHISEKGELSIKVDTIDNLFKNQTVGFIKLDVEGSEMSVLKGGINTIIKSRPLMAVSVYHKKDDLWNVILYINSLGLNYKFFLRHYTYGHNETILYCIPKQTETKKIKTKSK